MEVIGIPSRMLSIPKGTCECIELRPNITRKQCPKSRGNHTALLDASRHMNLSPPGSITSITKNVGASLVPGDHEGAEVGWNARPLHRTEESRSRDAVKCSTEINAELAAPRAGRFLDAREFGAQILLLASHHTSNPRAVLSNPANGLNGSSPFHVRKLRIAQDDLIQVRLQSVFDEGTEDLARHGLQSNRAQIRRVSEGPTRLLKEMEP